MSLLNCTELLETQEYPLEKIALNPVEMVSEIADLCPVVVVERLLR